MSSGNEQEYSLLCLGCGEDLKDRSDDRRALQGSVEAERVVKGWRDLLEMVQFDVDEDRLCTDNMMSEDVSSGKMCRKCFSGFVRYLKLQSALQEKLIKAVRSRVEKQTQERVLRKRPRLAQDVSRSSSLAGQSPPVSIHVDYKKTKNFKLTPSRKHLGKAVARRSKKTIAVECMKDDVVKKHIIRLVSNIVHVEMKKLCSESAQSVLCKSDPETIKLFSWKTLKCELAAVAPVLNRVLESTGVTHKNRPNFDAVVCLCVALLARNRNPKMSLVAKIFSLILYAGHSSKETVNRFQRLNLTVSFPSLIRLLDKIGATFDEKTKEWRDSLLTLLQSSDSVGRQHNTDPGGSISLNQDEELSSSEDSDDSDASDSDVSFQGYSPVTSDDEFSSSDEEESESSYGDTEDNTSSSQDLLVPTRHTSSQAATHSEHTGPGPVSTYHLCGDNLDKNVKRRYFRADNSPNTRSLHYFHYYAVKDRVDFSDMGEEPIQCKDLDLEQVALSLLPSSEDDRELRKNICVMISRVLYTYVPYFKHTFDGVIEWHIQHEYFREMCEPSEWVPMSIIPKNENKGDEMVDIMDTMHTYVPMIETSQAVIVPSLNESVQVRKATSFPILVHGDYLTASRARGAQKAKINSESPSSRLEGLVPVAADWHTKLKNLGIIWKYFYSSNSGRDEGTLYYIRNRLNRTNVPSEVKRDFNACEDFMETATASHIVAASLSTFGTKSLGESPNDSEFPTTLWTKSKEERKEWLDKMFMKVYDKFVCLSFDSCGSEYVHTDDDSVSSYAIQLLRIGCLYMEFADAIREGDGKRVLRCWRYFLPIFRASHSTNYACEALDFLYQHLYTSSPRVSNQLMWGRFINVHGRPGRNIPLDLHMEHLNRLAKDALRNTGSNKIRTVSISRAGRALGTLAPLLENFDTENSVQLTSSAYRKPTACSK